MLAISFFPRWFELCISCSVKQSAKMQNKEGQNMDLYIPKRCSATNRLITLKDLASVQTNIWHLDELDRYTSTFSTLVLCGFVHGQVEEADQLFFIQHRYSPKHSSSPLFFFMVSPSIWALPDLKKMPLAVPRFGDAIFASVERLNTELFTLTYGAIVSQLLTDLEEVQEVNKQLDK